MDKTAKTAVLIIGAFLTLNWPVPSAGKVVSEPQDQTKNSPQTTENQKTPV
jgi:hypothetical protein